MKRSNVKNIVVSIVVVVVLAVAMTLRALAQVGHMDLSRDFVLFDDAWFWSNVSKTAKRVVL